MPDAVADGNDLAGVVAAGEPARQMVKALRMIGASAGNAWSTMRLPLWSLATSLT